MSPAYLNHFYPSAWVLMDLNHQPATLQAAALPIELNTRKQSGPGGDRTLVLKPSDSRRYERAIIPVAGYCVLHGREILRAGQLPKRPVSDDGSEYHRHLLGHRAGCLVRQFAKPRCAAAQQAQRCRWLLWFVTALIYVIAGHSRLATMSSLPQSKPDQARGTSFLLLF